MNDIMLNCKGEQRRQKVREQKRNGLDYVEVSEQSQKVLHVYFLGSVPTHLSEKNIRIQGGQRVQNIQVASISPKNPQQAEDEDCLKVTLDKPGDFSTYTLQIVADTPNQPHPDFDPRYSHISFSFKVDCPSDLDCKSQTTCPPEQRQEPEISYLAKDYASFRQLILDRLSLIMPEWKESHVPDFGITLVELLAYVGDYLSYYQDAVATEAYLDTARQRISVSRHVRLIDYSMHEGCNARTWVWLEVGEEKWTLNPPLKPNGLISEDFYYFITRYPNAPSNGTVLNPEALRTVPRQQYEIFEPISNISINLYGAHNQIHFYTWGDRHCCLPKGATTATLLDEWQPPAKTTSPKSGTKQDGAYGEDTPAPPAPLERKLKLQKGDILIFEEVKGATTGDSADAELTHRHAVRLVDVSKLEDTLYTKNVSGINEALPTPVVEITWAMEDALPFPLCISAIGPAPNCSLITDITIAHGNVILVDHGQTLTPEQLNLVESKVRLQGCESEGQPTDITKVPILYRPTFKYGPLTFRQPLLFQDLSLAPASRQLMQDPRQALPQITALIGVPPNHTEDIDPNNPPDRPEWRWTIQPDLLSSYNRDRHFVVEMDDEGMTHLRFGDGELGQQPQAGTRFYATYRISNGIAGNIGADTISHIVFRQPKSGISIQPHNPFSARGGVPPEPLSDVKLYAPFTFRKELQRAITAQDYADLAMRDFGDRVQRSSATLRWTGSWYEVMVAIDPFGTENPSEALLKEIHDRLYRYHRMGHDVVVKAAVYVSLDIAITVCVKPEYLRGHVKADLLDVFSNRMLPSGVLGFFNPDNLTFGTGIALSKLVAYASAVTGVDNVIITTLKRQGEADQGALKSGFLPMGALEIPRLDNDPNFPENGKLTLSMRGGR
jgi:hypothetical protein